MDYQPSMLSENQPVDKSAKNQGSDYNPSPEEKAEIKRFEDLFKKAKRYRSRFDYNWGEFYKLFRGKQWKERRPSYRASEVMNLIFQTIQSQTPLETDTKPKFEFLPTEPQDRDFADLMNDISLSDWQKNNWLFKYTEVIYDKNLYGTGLSTLIYNTDKDQIEYKSIDPFYFFPDPSAQSLKERCGYTVYAEPMDVGLVKRKFPDYAKYIKADVTDLASSDRVDLSSIEYRSMISDQVEVQTSGYTTNKTDQVQVKTFYIEDDEIVEDECEDQDNPGQMKYVQRLKYPHGRKVIIVNDMKVWDDALEYDHHEFPYQRVVNYILPRQFWGISELEPLEGPQRLFNKLVSYCVDVLVLTGNPIWVVDTTAGIDTENLTNQPGLVVEKEPGSEVRRESGVQLQPYVLSLIDRLKQWYDQIAGAQDITRGETPGGVTAAAAIADLQDAAQTRIRLKLRNNEGYLQELGQQYVSLVMQFYTAPRVFRLTGKDGTERYFKMHIDKQQDDQGKSYYTANVQRFTDNNTLSPNIDQYQLRGELDVRIVGGSSLPFNKAQNEQRLYSLYDRHIIDAEEVLKGLDYPNWESIQQRMQEQASQAAQAQQQNAPQKVAS